MKRVVGLVAVVIAALMALAPAAGACGFLVSANGSVDLLRTTTFVSWEDGIEHYVTNFEFEGDSTSFGSIVPLPAEPTDVRRAGDWTLQRLVREVQPPTEELGRASVETSVAFDSGAEVLFETTVDSLDIVALKGGGDDVLEWVNDNGFDLPSGPETDHMLDYYGSRSPYFLAVRFDADRAAQDDFRAGDGIPVQITIPTPRPWVPLHILHGATPDTDTIEADVFLFTPERPDLLHGEGLTVERSEQASQLLLDDLRSDENMEWVPDEAWFTHLDLDVDAQKLTYDLSVGVDDAGPSFVDAGLTTFEPTSDGLEAFGLVAASDESIAPYVFLAIATAVAAGVLGATFSVRRAQR